MPGFLSVAHAGNNLLTPRGRQWWYASLYIPVPVRSLHSHHVATTCAMLNGGGGGGAVA